MECSYFDSRLRAACLVVGVGLLAFWAFGLHLGAFAQGATICAVLVLILPRTRLTLLDFEAYPWLTRTHQVFLASWLLLLLGYQYSEVLLGLQGIDFAIFTDVIGHIAKYGTFDSVLLGEGVHSFFTHHFSPILAFPGALAWLGVPAQFAGFLAQGILLAACLALLHRFVQALGFSVGMAWFVLVLFCLNPALRIGLFWEIHDECFALPFVVGAYLAWIKRSDWGIAVALLLCMLCKETFFFFALAFIFMVFLWRWLWDRTRDISLLPFALVLIVACFGIYFYMLAPLPGWEKTFDPSSRISSWQEFWSAPVLYAKSFFLFKLLLPLLFVPLWSWKGVVAAIPVGAFVGPILLSNFENMYLPYNYYSIVPTVILCCAAVVSLHARKLCKSSLPVGLYLLLISISLMAAGAVRPLRTILKLAKQPHFDASQLAMLPREATVVAQDYDVQYLLGGPKVYRAWTAERLEVPWQYLVIRKGAREPFPDRLLAQSTVCSENENWILRCRMP